MLLWWLQLGCMDVGVFGVRCALRHVTALRVLCAQV